MKALNVIKVGEFLKESRKSKRLTQSDVANRLGISAQAISKWERGENLPDVTFFPDISKIYNVSIEEILNAGEDKVNSAKSGREGALERVDETEDFRSQVSKIQQLMDNGLFKSILARFKELDDIQYLDVPLDFLAFLNATQKSELIEVLLDIQQYEIVLEDILPYTSSVHRMNIFRKILEKQDYEQLEPLAVYMSKNIKTEVLSILLENEVYDVIEDMMPFFTREQKDIMVESFERNIPDEDIIENYLPFLDRRQKERIRRLYHE